MAESHGPFTVDELHGRISQLNQKETCDLVTAYRCLAKFEELNLIARCDFGDGVIRYELSIHAGHHHHHIICRSCRQVQALPTCPVEDKALRMPKLGFKDVTHRLEYFGLCPACQ